MISVNSQIEAYTKYLKFLYCMAWKNMTLHSADDIDGLVQDCSNSSALAMKLLQSCTKPSVFSNAFF